MIHFKSFVGLLLVTLVLILTACAGSASPTQNQSSSSESSATSVPAEVISSATGEEKTLRVGVVFLNAPPAPPRGGFQSVKTGLAETLFRLGKDFSIEPWLAAQSQQLDDKTWQITLREGVKFHNGANMDASAVKASLERAITLNKGVAALLDVAIIEVIDPLTLKIVTNVSSPILPGLLSDPKTAIVDAAAAEAMGDAFAQRPVLTGPYKVVEFQVNKELVAVAHRDYWGPGPAVDRVVFTYLPDNASRVLALQGGDIDIAAYIGAPSVELLEDHPDFVVRPNVAKAHLIYMHLNQHKEAWKDAGLRRAISLAIDREALVNVLQGQAIPAVGPFPPVFLTCDELRAHPFDPAQARELLSAAGYGDLDGDGFVEKEGQTLKMTLLTYRQRSELPPLAEAIQAMLKTIGVQVEIRMVEQIKPALREGDWDGSVYFNNVVATGDPLGYLANWFTTGGSYNFGGYETPPMEELIRQLTPLTDQEERRKLACTASQTVLDDVPIIPLLYPNYNYGVSTEVVGFDEPYPSHVYLMHGEIGKR